MSELRKTIGIVRFYEDFIEIAEKHLGDVLEFREVEIIMNRSQTFFISDMMGR